MATAGDKRDLDGHTATVVVDDADVNGRIVVDIEGGGYLVIAAADFESRPPVDPRTPTFRTAWVVVTPALDPGDADLYASETDARAAAPPDAFGVLEVRFPWRDAEPITVR